METARLRIRVKDYLRHGSKSTYEIIGYLNMQYGKGSFNAEQLDCVFEDADIIKVGYVRHVGFRCGSYNTIEWDVRND